MVNIDLNVGFIYALVSAIALGGVITIDVFFKLHKVYERASQPIIMSSFMSLLTVPILFLFDDFQIIGGQAAWWAFGGGVLLAIAQAIYMHVIYSKDGDAIADTAEMSVYDSASPALIVLAVLLLPLFGVTHHDSIEPLQLAGGMIVIAGVLVFSWLQASHEIVLRWKYRLALVCFASLVAAYLWIEDAAIQQAVLQYPGMSDTQAYLAVSPYFWIGFGVGILFLLIPRERKAFVARFPRIIRYSWIVLPAELLAIISFWTALASLGDEHIVVTAVITGSYPIFVFIGGMLLRWWHPNAEPAQAKVSEFLLKLFVVLVIITGAALTY